MRVLDVVKGVSQVQVKLCGVFVMLMIFSVGISSAQAQNIPCAGKTITVKNFKVDSSTTFANVFVNAGAITNIKDSKLPFEIRMYMIDATNSLHATLIMLEGNGETIKTTRKRIILLSSKLARKEEILIPGQSGVMMSTVTKISPSRCEFLDSLEKNGLFVMQSSKPEEFKKNDRDTYQDAAGSYVFEMKIGNKIRNFTYFDDYNLNDQVKGRYDKIKAIMDSLISLFPG